MLIENYNDITYKDPEVPKSIEYKGTTYEVIFHNMKCFVIPRNLKLEEDIELYYEKQVNNKTNPN